LHLRDIKNLNLRKEDIISALEKARKEKFLDNLRYRHPNVKFDSKLRGFIGEIALRQWLENRGIQFNTLNYKEEDGGMDIDFLYKGKEGEVEIELKTSLIPDKDDKDFEKVIKRRDIKLIRRNDQKIEELKGDIHIQIYFNQYSEAKDKWLKEQHVDYSLKDPEYYFEKFKAYRYLNDTFLIGWIDKPSLIRNILKKKPENRTWSWSNSMRQFWTCNLKKEALKPDDLAPYLLNI
jgi:hypothetical protein